MKNFGLTFLAISAFVLSGAREVNAQVFESLPNRWEWIDNKEVAFIYESTEDSLSFAFNVGKKSRRPLQCKGRRSPSIMLRRGL